MSHQSDLVPFGLKELRETEKLGFVASSFSSTHVTVGRIKKFFDVHFSSIFFSPEVFALNGPNKLLR